MISPILTTATRYMLPLLLLFSVYLMQKGHNEPGGGFVGGLVAAAAFAFYAFAYGVEQARRALRTDPRNLIGVGLLTSVSSASLSLFYKQPFMTGLWLKQDIPIINTLGTPVVFDIGVYLVVVGVTLTIIFSLSEED